MPRLTISMLLMLLSLMGFSQEQIKGDTIQLGVNYIAQVEIKSDSAFPFCGMQFKFNRDCDNPQPGKNCCDYGTFLRNNEIVASYGFVNCPQGVHLSWHYGSTLEQVRLNFEGFVRQREAQQKVFKKQKITCMVFGKEVEGYLIETVSFSGYKNYSLLTYSSHNGYYFNLQYNRNKVIKSNEDIYPLFRQFLEIKEEPLLSMQDEAAQ